MQANTYNHNLPPYFLCVSLSIHAIHVVARTHIHWLWVTGGIMLLKKRFDSLKIKILSLYKYDNYIDIQIIKIRNLRHQVLIIKKTKQK